MRIDNGQLFNTPFNNTQEIEKNHIQIETSQKIMVKIFLTKG